MFLAPPEIKFIHDSVLTVFFSEMVSIWFRGPTYTPSKDANGGVGV